MTEQNKRILIACPVRNRAWILPYYLSHLYNIDYKKKNIDLYFLINNSTDNSLSILQQFKEKYKHEYNSIIIEIINKKDIPPDERTDSIRKKYIYDWLSFLRNRILSKCVKLDCDYLLSIDCDILVKPNIINNLLSHNKDIVSSLIYNGYMVCPFAEAYKFPNILQDIGNRVYKHIVNYKTKHPEKNSPGTLIEVDFTGACFMAKKEVCEKAEYQHHAQGEDEYFCWSAKQAGFKLYCDVYAYSQHIMNEKFLDQFKDFGLD